MSSHSCRDLAFICAAASDMERHVIPQPFALAAPNRVGPVTHVLDFGCGNNSGYKIPSFIVPGGVLNCR